MLTIKGIEKLLDTNGVIGIYDIKVNLDSKDRPSHYEIDYRHDMYPGIIFKARLGCNGRHGEMHDGMEYPIDIIDTEWPITYTTGNYVWEENLWDVDTFLNFLHTITHRLIEQQKYK